MKALLFDPMIQLFIFFSLCAVGAAYNEYEIKKVAIQNGYVQCVWINNGKMDLIWKKECPK